MKSQRTIQRNLKELRARCIDGIDDPVQFRIAYAMETAVRWATSKTVGWPGLVSQARVDAQLLRAELKSRGTR